MQCDSRREEKRMKQMKSRLCRRAPKNLFFAFVLRFAGISAHAVLHTLLPRHARLVAHGVIGLDWQYRRDDRYNPCPC